MCVGTHLQRASRTDPVTKPLPDHRLLPIIKERRCIDLPDALHHRLHFVDVLPALAAGTSRPEPNFGAYVYLHGS